MNIRIQRLPFIVLVLLNLFAVDARGSNADCAELMKNIEPVLKFKYGTREESQQLSRRALELAERGACDDVDDQEQIKRLETIFSAFYVIPRAKLSLQQANDRNLVALLLALGAAKHAKSGSDVTLQEREAEIVGKLFGTDHPRYADSLSNLGDWQSREGRFAKAKALHARTLAIRQAAFGPEDEMARESMVRLADVLIELGNDAEAEKIFRQLSAGLKPDMASKQSYYLHKLANLYLKSSQLEKAEATLKEQLAVQRSWKESVHIRLAEVYSRQKRYKEAEDRYQQALGLMKVEPILRNELLAEAHAGLATVYFATGKRDEARAAAERSAAVLEKSNNPNARWINVDARAKLASYHQANGELAKAAELYKQCVDASEDQWRTLPFLAALADLYRAQKKDADAAALEARIKELRRRAAEE